MAKTDFAFRYSFRVRFSESDAQGIVFNARYLDYADIAITEYWRVLNIKSTDPKEQVDTHVKKATVLWHAPVMPDELIEVMARTIHISRTSFTQMVEIHGVTDDDSDSLRAEIELVYVRIDTQTHRPIDLPAWLGETFSAFDAQAPQARAIMGEVRVV